MVKRSSFTLIELIFAIVVIGISVAAVPQMLYTNAQTLERSLMKEAVFLASAEANRMLTFQWDPAAVAAGAVLSYAKILDTNVSTASRRVCFDPVSLDLDPTMASCTGTYAISVFPDGGVPFDNHRRFHSTVTAPVSPKIGGQADFNQDIDLTGNEGYKRAYNVSVQSGYANQAFGTGFSGLANDVKMIQITVTDTTAAAGSSVVLRTYAYNIGEVGYARRVMP